MRSERKFEVPDQTGKLAVVTGTGGLGYHVAFALAKAGADVIIAGRSVTKGAEAVAQILSAVSSVRVDFEMLDLADLDSVRDVGLRLKERGVPIDLLVNNAGIMSPPTLQLTSQGHEAQFGVNYLSHFALTAALAPLLREAEDARVVSVTSLAQHYAKFDIDNLRSEKGYHPGRAYCLSKLLQAIFATELQRRSEAAGWGISSIAAHPGFAGTNLFETSGAMSRFLSTKIILPLLGQSAAAGALPILFAATSPDAVGGRMYAPNGFMQMKGVPGESSFAKSAQDARAAREVWELSQSLAQIEFN
jgi:NAD(P)-dependent dehydrogenase (short-subunit alcohol dehydrogenase family)